MPDYNVCNDIMLQHFQPKSILKKGALGKAKAKPVPVGKFGKG